MMRPDLQVKLADGTDVGYAEAGDPDGYPVLHLHGSPSSRLEVSFPAFLQAAEDLGIRIVAPDRPGMGLSTFRRFSIQDYARLVGSFADALGLERFAVTGLSGGGKYACACAWVLSERVTRVALVSLKPPRSPGTLSIWMPGPSKSAAPSSASKAKACSSHRRPRAPPACALSPYRFGASRSSNTERNT
jgi:pimeloyl-ACP methyl ester carboxylesterase